MRFHLGNPSFPQYSFNLFDVKPEAEKRINRLSPVATVARAFDWPRTFGGFRGWTDTFNSIWWPQGMDQFATCVLVIDDARNDILNQSITAQKNATTNGQWRWPYLVLSCRLAPPDSGLPGEQFTPRGLGPVTEETELMAWKLYPLAPINVSSLDSSEAVRGLWLLPLVDIRYFMRNVPLNAIGGSSSSGTGGEYPLIEVNRDETPEWMPLLRAYPQDLFAPLHYVPIDGNGTDPAITSGMRLGEAADLQATLQNWRIVCRDIRTNYNRGTSLFPHSQFTGVVADYPEQFHTLPGSYHLDALGFLDEDNTRYAGGECDVRILDDLICRKLQFIFDVKGTEAVYSVTLRTTVDYPETVADFAEDTNGPDPTEKTLIPVVRLGKEVTNRYPDAAEHADLVTAAKRWFLLYCVWRQKQAYIKFPGIFPVIPNGHSQVIRWDFRSTLCETTYVALEGVQGTPTDHVRAREPFYAQIDGEGLVEDGLHGVYAFTELLDHDGQLTNDHPSPRRGYVAGVNGAYLTVNPARDETGKVAVPVGLPVWLKPGVPYLDVAAGQIFDHYLFTTSDLTQLVRIKRTYERSPSGFIGAVIETWDGNIRGWRTSKDIWTVLGPPGQ